MATVRMMGLSSGMDTESIIQELVSAQSIKKTQLEQKKTKEEWKQDIWKDLNTKIYSFYTDQVAKMRIRGSFNAKSVTSSDETKITATAGADAPNGTHSIQVKNLAGGQNWTSGKFDASVTEDTLLADLGMEMGSELKLTVGSGDKTKTGSLVIDENTTIKDFIKFAKNAGVNASFDKKQHRLFLSSNGSGKANSFTLDSLQGGTKEAIAANRIREGVDYDSLTAAEKNKVNTIIDYFARNPEESIYRKKLDSAGNETDEYELTEEEQDAELNKRWEYMDYLSERMAPGYSTEILEADIADLEEGYAANHTEGSTAVFSGMEALKFTEGDGATLVDAEDAVVIFNGATFTSDSNTFEANGITFNLKGVTDGEISVNVSADVDGTYNRVKEMIKAYNELIDNLNTLYNAKAVKGYEPLTAEEKGAMSDEEVKLWEDKIKGSLLRRDENLRGLTTAMRTALASTVTVDGKKYTLASFGIETSSDYTEYGKLHIRGDADDAKYADKKDKLKKALEEDPNLVADVLAGVMKNLYNTMNDKMKGSTLSSALTFYNDKTIKNTIQDYEDKIKAQEEKLNTVEDKYYKQFSTMETMLSKINSQNSYVSQLMGM